MPLPSPSIHSQKPKLYTFEEESEKAVTSVVAVAAAAVVGKGREAKNLMMKFERN
jgi:hypothetical protein